MTSELYSVGLDVGTTTTQMVVSCLQVENKASGFAVPEMAISGRRILYRSPVVFTPLASESRVDGNKLQQFVLQQYGKAGIRPEQVDTGAVIITGETSRKENADQVLSTLSAFAGDFVVATAGPDLESVLAAKGAGAVAYSEKTGETVLHMDIGGGTSNLALIRRGQIVQTGCLNVGGRLVRCAEDGAVTYISPVLNGLTELTPGSHPDEKALTEICQMLTQALEMAAGRRPETPLMQKLWTAEAHGRWHIPKERVTVSFSGGVADCIETQHLPLAFGDVGVLLGRAIAGSTLCTQGYILGKETIRATVIGAGCHSTQLSGSTVFCRNVELPRKNLPVVYIPPEYHNDSGYIASRLAACDSGEGVIAMGGDAAPDYNSLRQLAQILADAAGQRPVYVCLQQDMAKALGQCLSLLLPPDRPCMCLDKLIFGPESYLDVGQPVGPCFPVVIKTLVLDRN